MMRAAAATTTTAKSHKTIKEKGKKVVKKIILFINVATD